MGKEGERWGDGWVTGVNRVCFRLRWLVGVWLSVLVPQFFVGPDARVQPESFSVCPWRASLCMVPMTPVVCVSRLCVCAVLFVWSSQWFERFFRLNPKRDSTHGETTNHCKQDTQHTEQQNGIGTSEISSRSIMARCFCVSTLLPCWCFVGLILCVPTARAAQTKGNGKPTKQHKSNANTNEKGKEQKKTCTLSTCMCVMHVVCDACCLPFCVSC